MNHPDLASEQAYLDRAHACVERMREVLARADRAGDSELAALALEAWSAGRLATLEDARRGLLFGRLDFEQVERPLYVGRRWVHDEERRQVVVSWQAPAARPFYTATPVDPQRVTLRRRFRVDGRRLVEISDEALDGTMLDGVGAADFLLEELGRDREAHMRDIVATIQADQYRLITREPGRPLVIQGGPGTGKTAVGLHRASWLLYTARERRERGRVLVVGPNRTFMEYVAHVLPALGEDAVEQRAVAELVDGVEVTRADPPEVARLKADPRLAAVLRRAAALRLRAEPEALLLRVDGRFVEVTAREVAAALAEVRERDGTTARARERFRAELVRRFYRAYGRVHGSEAVRDAEDVERALRRGGLLNRVVAAAWPAVTPEQLVRSLLAAPGASADGILDEAEQRLLRRRGAGWSEGDVPLLDEAHALVGDPARTFSHAIVDEAQDLTPMQLRMVARRAPHGGLTILGDIAQGTGPVAYDSWAEVVPQLPHGGEAEVEELRHAYRVPSEIMELALPLLEEIAPGTTPPLAYRTGAPPPLVRRVEAAELLPEAYREAARLAAGDGLVALIVPAELEEPALAGRSLYEGVPLLTPRAAKGLEFDHVVLVEPALVADAPQGLRELYVALTRPTRTLVLVHARPLPERLAAAVRP